MTAAPSPSSAPGALDSDLFRLVSSQALQRLLQNIVGPKTLVLAPPLAGPLGLVTEVGLLKNYGVTKLFWLESGPLAQAERNIVYLCRPELRWMKVIAEQIKATPSASSHVFHLLVVPRMTTLCTQLLSDLGVLGSLEVQEFQLGLIPLEKDLLSLESEDGWRKLALDGEYSGVYDMAKAMMTIQRAFGIIPRIIGKGHSAKRMAMLMQRLRAELPQPSATNPALTTGSIDSLVVIDRQVDLVTPLCTQLTYEGLIDEVIGIKNSHVDVDPNLINPAPTASTSSPALGSQAPPKKKKHLLSSSADALFAELRDKNFAVVGSILNRTARRLNDDYERRHQAKTPAELRQFVGQLGGLQSEHQALRLHTGLTEQIMAVTATDEFNTALEVQQNLIAGVDSATQENSIRDLLNQGAPLRTVLRLLCLYSLTANGLKQKTFDEFRAAILQTYGYEHLPLLLSLQDLGLFIKTPPAAPSAPSLSSLGKSSANKSPFTQVRKALRLVVEDVDEREPTDCSYVFSGYAPLSVRLVQCAVAGTAASVKTGTGGVNGWKGVEEVVRALEGETFEEWQTLEGVERSHAGAERQRKTTIVCFLGGVTYAEIAALRFLNSTLPDRNLLIVTTGIVQGGAMLSSLMPQGSQSAPAPVAA